MISSLSFILEPLLIFSVVVLAIFLIVRPNFSSGSGEGSSGSGRTGGSSGGSSSSYGGRGSGSSSSRNVSSSDVSRAESALEDTAERVRAAERSEDGQDARRNINELESALEELERPVEVFQALAISAEQDIDEVLTRAEEFENSKRGEEDAFSELKELLEGIDYRLNQLTGRDSTVEGSEDEIKDELMDRISRAETVVEQLEEKQSDYSEVLDEEENELLTGLKENREALEDVEKCISIVAEAEGALEDLSRIPATAENRHDLELTEREIEKIEKSLKQIYEMEDSIIERLDRLEQLEQESEEITEEELEEIKLILGEENDIEQKLEEAKDDGSWHNHFSEEEFRRIMEVFNRIRDILENLGLELKEEESEEEEIRDEAHQEEEVSREASEDIDEGLSGLFDRARQRASEGFDQAPDLSKVRRELGKILDDPVRYSKNNISFSGPQELRKTFDDNGVSWPSKWTPQQAYSLTKQGASSRVPDGASPKEVKDMAVKISLLGLGVSSGMLMMEFSLATIGEYEENPEVDTWPQAGKAALKS